MNIYKKIIRYWYVKKGFIAECGWEWYCRVIRDFKTNKKATLRQKLWAYKRGFLSKYADYYGLTEENYRSRISMRDYQWIFPLNVRYASWIDNKLTLKYIFTAFDEYMPEYYYHLFKDRTLTTVMPLMDLPEGYGNSYDEIIRLLEEKCELVLKRAVGSMAIGFYRFSYRGGVYYLNEEEATRQQLINKLNTLTDYIVTEYVFQHKMLRDIYDKSLNTVRVVVLNEKNNEPIILGGNFRAGTDGKVVNYGVFTHLDIENGKLLYPHTVINGEFIPSATHPNSGAGLEITLPKWDEVRAVVIKMSKYIPQLEWLGFDVAITDDGIKIIEINTHPIFDATYLYLSDEYHGYLLRRLEQKKKIFNRK